MTFRSDAITPTTEDHRGEIARPRNRPATRSRQRTRTLAGVAVAGVIALGLGACGGGSDDSSDAADELAEKLAEAGSGDADVDIDSETGQVDVSTPDGDMSFGSGAELPDDFPDGIPFPEGSEITSTLNSTDGGVKTWSAMGTLADADDSTFDEVVALFTDDGWTSTMNSSGSTGGGAGSTAILTKGDLQVLVSTQIGIEGLDDSFSYVVTQGGM
ncbi:MAG: hypothetical protein V9E94_08965 [Microthrixaceae bacterium]